MCSVFRMKNIALTGFVFMLIAADAIAGGNRFVDEVFTSTGAVSVTEDAQMHGMPIGEGLRAGVTSNCFVLIKLKIHIICAGMGNAKQTGSWQRLWSPVHGPAMAAPFKAGEDVVLIMHFPGTGVLFTKMVPTGEEPEEDWTKPEEPRKRFI